MVTILSIKEAAAKCGYSDKTLRNRIKAGTLRAEQVIGKYGPEWMISEEALEEAGFSLGNTQEDDGSSFNGSFEGSPDNDTEAQDNDDPKNQATALILSQQEQIGFYKAKVDALEKALETLDSNRKEMARVYEEHLNSLKTERDRALEEVQEWKREVAVAKEEATKKKFRWPWQR